MSAQAGDGARAGDIAHHGCWPGTPSLGWPASHLADSNLKEVLRARADALRARAADLGRTGHGCQSSNDLVRADEVESILGWLESGDALVTESADSLRADGRAG